VALSASTAVPKIHGKANHQSKSSPAPAPPTGHKNLPVHIGIVAGEASGDLLGAGLIQALRVHLPDAHFEGIGGPRMEELGCRVIYAMDRISLLGFEGLLQKLLGILRIRRNLARYFRNHPPAVFIGIDVPDFNLPLEKTLKRYGIPTIHYVSPTVWAWRGYRIHKISRAVNHMLTLFPFEAEYYRRHHVPVTFVGHPMADQISEKVNGSACRARLALPANGVIVALLPGSRMSELDRLASLFIKTAAWLHQRHSDLHFVVPFVDPAHQRFFKDVLDRHAGQGLPITLLSGHSRDAMGAADVVLLASGTAALEAALLRRPMVVTYRLNWFSYLLARFLAHVKYCSMPNNLAGHEVVPELLQKDAVPEKLGRAVESFLNNPKAVSTIRTVFADMHRTLRGNANQRAAEIVLQILAAGARQ